jgi:hypothetical protein
MSTLKDIMNTVQYGEDYMSFEKVKKSILENYDKENDIFFASGRIKDIKKTMVVSEEAEKIIDRISTKCDLVEQRIYQGKEISEAYKKIQASAIMEDCNSIIKMVNSRPEYDKISSKQELGQILATAQYFVENTLDDLATINESTNSLFNKYVKDESDKISEVL